MDTKNLDSETLPVGEEKTELDQSTACEQSALSSTEQSVVDDENVEKNSLEDTVQKLRDLLTSPSPQRKDLSDLKAHFYTLLRNEAEKQKQTFLNNGGNEIDFVINESDLYTEGKQLIAQINEKRAKISAIEETEKEANVIIKQAIIEQVKALSENQSHKDFNKIYQDFRSLQQQWSEIKQVPQAKENALWKQYHYYVEKFYDLVRINNEFREYDFKKNLELKIALCEKAERLMDKGDVVASFRQLQSLHAEWREVGPVAEAKREDIWTRFKTASTAINKKHQAHFEKLKKKETENLALKVALCEKLEAIDCNQIKTHKGWNSKAKEVQDIQNQWRKVGYIPKKMSEKIYLRYRAACDSFFKAKNEFNKSLLSEKEENLKRKIALCELAEGLKDSTDWKKTSQKMVEIQREWKKIGTVPNKHIDSIWKRFVAACDYFFEQKNEHTSPQNNEEAKNLEAKKAVIKKIKSLDTDSDAESAITTLRTLISEWNSIGFVPFKMKDKILRDFQEATDQQFEKLNVSKNDRKLESFKNTLSKASSKGGGIIREREKLMRQFERMKSELQTYENNIGFLSVSSKKGSSLLDEMNQKVTQLKTEIDSIVKKIEDIDMKL